MRPALGSAVALVVALVACTSVTEGQPQPAGAGGASSTRGGTSTGLLAPKVTEPLTPEPFVADPCRAIVGDRAGSLSLRTPGQTSSDAGGSSCIWLTKDEQNTVAVSYMTGLKGGLSELYAQHQRGPAIFKYFEPTAIAGYPALYADKLKGRGSGSCLLNVGVTDNLFMVVEVVNLAHEGELCGLAVEVGEAMIATMKKGV